MPITLSDGEWKLMNQLWEESPQTITELTATLKPQTGWTKHTIISMLTRLEVKGAVNYTREKAKHYAPCIGREDAAGTETAHFLDRVYGGSLGLLLNTMVQSNGLSREELDELSTILQQAKEDSP